MSAVRVLAQARDTDPEAFTRSEAQLVEAARIHSMNDLGRVAAYWRQAVEREHALDGEDKLRERRRLHASVTFLGMVRVDADLDPETGETLLTRCGRCSMPDRARGRRMIERRRSGEPTRSARSVASGWTGPTARTLPASDRT